MSAEMFMLYIWEGINKALGSDPTVETHVAKFIYDNIKERLEEENILIQSPCDMCQEFDCYGCEEKKNEHKI